MPNYTWYQYYPNHRKEFSSSIDSSVHKYKKSSSPHVSSSKHQKNKDTPIKKEANLFVFVFGANFFLVSPWSHFILWLITNSKSSAAWILKVYHQHRKKILCLVRHWSEIKGAKLGYDFLQLWSSEQMWLQEYIQISQNPKSFFV